MKTIDFTTAQHVKIEYEIASTLQRVVASIIDVFAFFLYFLIVGMAIDQSMFQSGIGTQKVVVLMLLRIPWLLYSHFIEYVTRGFSEYFTRWVFRVVDIWFGFGFLAVLFSSTSQRGQRLGDTMANTVLIRKNNTNSYSLKNVLSIKSKENHQPTYHQVTRFTDEDMILIKNTLQRLNHSPSEETKKFAIELAHETARQINLPETPEKKVQFLRTVLLDYVVLTR